MNVHELNLCNIVKLFGIFKRLINFNIVMMDHRGLLCNTVSCFTVFLSHDKEKD